MNLYDKAYGPGNFTVAVTDSEGGQWIPFSEWKKWSDNNKVHSIAFSDGSIWDAFDGWRKPRYDGSTIDAEGWRLVHQGGHHNVWCDGKVHHKTHGGFVWGELEQGFPSDPHARKFKCDCYHWRPIDAEGWAEAAFDKPKPLPWAMTVYGDGCGNIRSLSNPDWR